MTISRACLERGNELPYHSHRTCIVRSYTDRPVFRIQRLQFDSVMFPAIFVGRFDGMISLHRVAAAVFGVEVGVGLDEQQAAFS